jgi:hypothetical protein
MDFFILILSSQEYVNYMEQQIKTFSRLPGEDSYTCVAGITDEGAYGL